MEVGFPSIALGPQGMKQVTEGFVGTVSAEPGDKTWIRSLVQGIQSGLRGEPVGGAMAGAVAGGVVNGSYTPYLGAFLGKIFRDRAIKHGKDGEVKIPVRKIGLAAGFVMAALAAWKIYDAIKGPEVEVVKVDVDPAATQTTS